MTLKGEYSDLTSYSVGDVVQFTGGMCYVMKTACGAGNPPTDTRYWEWIGQGLQDTVDLILDAIDISQGGALAGKVANSLDVTKAGKVLDARQGKALKDLIDGLDERVTALEGGES
jgi:hypothetical protein